MASESRHLPRFEPGKKPFGDYAVDRFLRWSGYYEQYEGSTASGVPVGIKIVSSEQKPTDDRLASAARPYAVGLVSVFDFSLLKTGEVVVITEPVTPTLREKLTSGTLTFAEATGYLRDVAQALFAIENHGGMLPILSPDSITIRDDGVVLDDHFLHALYEGGRYPIVLEQAAYMAPEVDRDPPDPVGAMFMLGTLFFEMLCGRTPFTGGPLTIIADIRSKDVDLGAAPAGAQPLLEKLLARDPSKRLRNFDQLLTALESSLGRVLGDRSLLPGDADRALADHVSMRPSDDEGPRMVPLGTNEQGYPEFRRSIDGGIMILLPGGTFVMGDTNGRPEEQPPTEVTIGPLLIDKHPVTWEMFVAMHKGHDRSCGFCAAKEKILPSRFMSTPKSSRTIHDHTEFEMRLETINEAISEEKGETIPVTYVTAPEAEEYARAVGCELPSEAEWEFAYRSGQPSPYYWGVDPDPKMAWFADNSGGRPHRVGELPPNGFGLLDMAGNVFEFCRDQFVKEILEMIAAGAASVEELVTGVDRPSPRRSIRGGSFGSSAAGIRASFRSGAAPEMRSEARGIRLVMRQSNAPDWAVSAFTGETAEPESGPIEEMETEPKPEPMVSEDTDSKATAESEASETPDSENTTEEPELEATESETEGDTGEKVDG